MNTRTRAPRLITAALLAVALALVAPALTGCGTDPGRRRAGHRR